MNALRLGGVIAILMASALLAGAATKPARAAEGAAEATPPIQGVEIARAGGTFLGLQIVNNNFVLSFYDAQKRKTAPDVARAMIRWTPRAQLGDERAVLTAGGDGSSLTSPKTVKPPHNFRAFIGLFAEGSETALETYSIEVKP